MPWTDDLHGDFSEAEAWLPIDDGQRRLSAATQADDVYSILHVAALFIQLRKKFPALVNGSLRTMWSQQTPHLLVFTRRNDAQELICAFNFGQRPATIAGLQGSDVAGVWGRGAISGNAITVKPKCAFVGIRRDSGGIAADIEQRPLDALSAAVLPDWFTPEKV